jgi:hypothetical protein
MQHYDAQDHWEVVEVQEVQEVQEDWEVCLWWGMYLNNPLHWQAM